MNFPTDIDGTELPLPSLPLASQPPLNLQIFISSDAFNNSAFLYEQLEFTWLIGICAIAVKAGCEIDSPSGDPIPLYHTLGGNCFASDPTFPVSYLRSPLNPSINEFAVNVLDH